MGHCITCKTMIIPDNEHVCSWCEMDRHKDTMEAALELVADLELQLAEKQEKIKRQEVERVEARALLRRAQGCVEVKIDKMEAQLAKAQAEIVRLQKSQPKEGIDDE